MICNNGYRYNHDHYVVVDWLCAIYCNQAALDAEEFDLNDPVADTDETPFTTKVGENEEEVDYNEVDEYEVEGDDEVEAVDEEVDGEDEVVQPEEEVEEVEEAVLAATTVSESRANISSSKLIESKDILSKRAERFGVEPSEVSKIESRKNRFGDVSAAKKQKISNTNAITTSTKQIIDPEKIKKRLDRFGEISPTAVKIILDDKKKARAERFNLTPNTSADEGKVSK